MADATGRRKVTVKIRSENTYNSVGSVRADLITADYTFYPNSTDAGTYTRKNSGYITASFGQLNYPQWYQDYGPVTLKQGTLSSSVCGSIFDPVRNNSTFNTALDTILESDIIMDDTAALRRLQDKIILDSSNNTYYRISVISISEGKPITVTSDTTGGQAALNALHNAMNYNAGASTLQGVYTTFTASNSSESCAIQLTNVGVSLYVDLNSDRAHLNDAPYDMFCIPFSDTLKLKYDSTEFTCSKNVALSMATEIAKDLGSGTVYDVQLLPYCPNRTLVVNSSSPSVILNLASVKYDLIKESVTNNPKSAVIWCTESTFQVPISTESGIVKFEPTTDAPSRIITQNYYTIPNNITSFQGRMAVGTINSNNVVVYKVNRSTNRVMNSSLYNTVEVNIDGYLNIYTLKNAASPEIHVDLQDYNSADYYYVFWLKNVSYTAQNIEAFSTKVRITKNYSILNPGNDALTRKLANECDLVRIVSQNYSAIFEFSPAKSGGVDGFLADCTYKPWAPYIHILPKLKGLYGDNFVSIDDARGLICGGDMSLPQLSNA